MLELLEWRDENTATLPCNSQCYLTRYLHPLNGADARELYVVED